MATLTIRNLDDETKARLRVQAAVHGHSMEEEARQILRCQLLRPEHEAPAPRETVGQRLLARFAHIPGEVDLVDELIQERRAAALREAAE